MFVLLSGSSHALIAGYKRRQDRRSAGFLKKHVSSLADGAGEKERERSETLLSSKSIPVPSYIFSTFLRLNAVRVTCETLNERFQETTSKSSWACCRIFSRASRLDTARGKMRIEKT